MSLAYLERFTLLVERGRDYGVLMQEPECRGSPARSSATVGGAGVGVADDSSVEDGMSIPLALFSLLRWTLGFKAEQMLQKSLFLMASVLRWTPRHCTQRKCPSCLPCRMCRRGTTEGSSYAPSH
ncbi:UNVERIFIED_CONTAM: hypothetical protein FKN15_070674 [Acipenser sinensis]